MTSSFDNLDYLLTLDQARLATRCARSEKELAEVKDELEHLKSEFSFDSDRGDHLVYRHEWEEFNQWQRSQKADSASSSPTKEEDSV